MLIDSLQQVSGSILNMRKAATSARLSVSLIAQHGDTQSFLVDTHSKLSINLKTTMRTKMMIMMMMLIIKMMRMMLALNPGSPHESQVPHIILSQLLLFLVLAPTSRHCFRNFKVLFTASVTWFAVQVRSSVPRPRGCAEHHRYPSILRFSRIGPEIRLAALCITVLCAGQCTVC